MGETRTLPPGVPRRPGEAPPRKVPGAPRRSWAGGVEKLRGPRGVPTMRRGVPGTDSVGSCASVAVLFPSCSRKAFVAGMKTAL